MSGRFPIGYPEAEKAVIGFSLTSEAALCQVISTLPPDAFSDPSCAAVREAMAAVQKRGERVDAVNVWAALRSAGTAGRFRDFDDLNGLRRFAQGSLEEKIRSVLRAARVRAAQGNAARLAKEGLNPATLESPEAYFAELARVGNETLTYVENSATHIRAGIRETFVRIIDRRKRKSPVACPTGFYSLDKILEGWEPQDVNVLGARPGVGKSALMIQAATNGASVMHPQMIFSLEMPTTGLNLRQLLMTAKIDPVTLYSEYLSEGEWKRLIAAGDRLSGLPMWFDDETTEWGAIEAKVEAWVKTVAVEHIAEQRERLAQAGEPDVALVPVVWIDYLQLAEGDPKVSREQQIAKMSRAGKKLAKRTGCALNFLCQINRKVETENRRPRPSDLRESGSIEQDASKIVFLHPKSIDDDDHPGGDVREGIVAKNRNGGLGLADLRFIGPQTRFEAI
jgi:replicative DNA helicase